MTAAPFAVGCMPLLDFAAPGMNHLRQMRGLTEIFQLGEPLQIRKQILRHADINLLPIFALLDSNLHPAI
jgi:hypothetical protein